MEYWQLKQMQELPLEVKILKTQQRIREWYEYWGGKVYVSFSGGKDSTVLLNIAREIYPDVPAVFVDTGLEYPEIKEFVKTIDNVITLRPKMSFAEVINKHGYPVVSKLVSRFVKDLSGNPSETTKNLRLNGIKKDGSKAHSSNVLAKKWRYLVNAPFKISNRCCDIMKKNPMKKYEKETGRHAIIGTMTHESKLRETTYLKHGCNAFDAKKPISVPISFWTEQDVLQYIKKNNLSYASVYGDIVEDTDNNLKTTGEHRTGCMFCMFGCHLEKGENRFQRMKRTHPKIYDYCINKLGIGEVLDYIHVSY